MWSLLFVLVLGKGLVVGKGVQLKLKAGDTVDARRVSCGILVKAGGKLLVEGSKTKPVVFLGGAGVVIHSEGKLEIHHAIFACDQKKRLTSFQQLQGTAIRVGNGTANISSIEFSNWKRVISLEGVPARGYQSITANRFLQNETAIEVNTNSTTPLNLDLSCNVFEPGLINDDGTISRTLNGNAVGIKVATGSNLGKVGVSPTSPSDPYTYAANIWPSVSRSPLGINQNIETIGGGWTSPTGWTSVQSNNTGTYFKFANEFLGTRTGLFELIPAVGLGRFARTPNQNIGSTDPALFTVVCNDISGDPFVAPKSIGHSTNPSGRISAEAENYLLQNIPNPAAQQTIIGYHISIAYNTASLQITEIGTGKLVETKMITPNSPKALIVDLKKYPVGLYMYKLLVDGKLEDAKKMIVQR